MISFLASDAFLFLAVVLIAVIALVGALWGRRMPFFEKDINEAAREQRAADRQSARVTRSDEE